ncbi:periplasmic binding protein-like I [Catenaria anguillulae PL171]|uniref:Periplasmic binding protein-like I n=1 Tax=Catenaria anguillulae PL171 TaxID=765915 RepID=A0A1Y2HTU2_9FUNG|nr:periplasmic binding protein-like I [Catenaria anguillulae PL171]
MIQQPKAPTTNLVRMRLSASTALWVTVYWVLLAATQVHIANAVNFNISVNLPILTGGKRDANLALFIRANAEATLAGIDPTGHHSFNLVYYSTNGTARNATLAAQAAIAEHNVVGIIGDRVSQLTIPMVLVGSRTSTWFCSGGSTSSLLSDKSLYHTFLRTISTDSIQGPVLASLVSFLDASGLIGPDYVWIAPHAISGYSTIATRQADRELANGLLYVFPKEDSFNAEYNASIQRFIQRYPQEPIPSSASSISIIVSDTSVSALLDRSYFPSLKKYFLHPFAGVSGDVVFDDNGDRINSFQVFNFWQDLSVRPIAPVRFLSGSSNIPADMPDRDLLYITWSSPLASSSLPPTC